MDLNADNNLTYNKLLKIINLCPKIPKLDDGWQTPWAKPNNNTYYVSPSFFQKLKLLFAKKEDKTQSLYMALYKDDILYANLGIYVLLDTRIENTNEYFWYQDKDNENRLLPVLILGEAIDE